MKTNYFTATFKPDIVDGDISKLIADDKSDTAFSTNDLLFDWQEVEVPRGACALVDALIHMVGEDGGNQANVDLTLIFAKSINGTAPTSLGEENAAPTMYPAIAPHIIGATKIEGSANGIGQCTLGHGTLYYGNVAGNNGNVMQCVLEGEPESGSNVGYDKIYCAAICESAGVDFSTGVLATGAVTSGSATDITVDTVDVRKAFAPDDIVYIHDVDTAIGVVSSVPDATSLILKAANGAAIANNDEFINATPITVTLKFSK